MKPEDKKLVAEALLEAAKAVTTSLTDLSEDDWLVVYHGTSLSEVPSLINGFDATRLKYRLYGGPKHRGLFVTPDFKTAERFAPYGEVVLELLVRVKNLHGTDYYGRTGRQQNQEQKTEEWLAGKFPNSFRPYLSLTLTQSVEPQALLIGLVSPKQILRVWHRAKRSDAGRWYTRSEFLALGLEAGPSADEPQGIKKKVEDLGIDLSSPRLSLDEFLDATARLADVPRSRVESALSVRAPKGEDEMVRLIERFGFQPKAAQSFARKFMKSLTNKQVAKALLAAASKLEASGSPVQASSQIARKDNGRPRGTFIGSADGWEYTEGYPLGLRGGWAASIGLSSSNNWMNLSVEGATEYDENFQNAFREIVAEYPEVAQYVVSFDGPYIPVSELLEMKSKDFRDIVFLHGTSSAVVPRIMAEGLRPRGETGVDPAYGYASSAKPSLPDRVYLTTQPAMANFAARSAARVHGGEPVVLEITGLDQSYALPDEDSRAKTAEESLARLGSIAYSRTIPTSKIRAVNGKIALAAVDSSSLEDKIMNLKLIEYDRGLQETYVEPPVVNKNWEEVPSAVSQASVDSYQRQSQRKNDRVENISIDSLKIYQDLITRENLLAMAKEASLPPIKVVRFKGEEWVIDGNHRTALAILRGDKNIKAYVHDLDAREVA